MSDYSYSDDDLYSDHFDDPSPPRSRAAEQPSSPPRQATPSGSERSAGAGAGEAGAGEAGAVLQPKPSAKAARGGAKQAGRRGSDEQATAEELSTIRELRGANERLREQLMGLSRQLDDALTRRGERVGRMTRMRTRHFDTPEAERLARENEKLRKRNVVLQQQLRGSEDAERCVELQNLIAEREREAMRLREEHRSLENVSANQQRRLDSVRTVEDELAEARSQHAEAVRRLRERITAVKTAKESDDRAVKQQQQALNALQDKIRACEGARGRLTPHSVDELLRRLEEREHQIDAMKYQVLVLSRNNDGDRRRMQQQARAQARELQRLHRDTSELRARASAQGVAVPPPPTLPPPPPAQEMVAPAPTRRVRGEVSPGRRRRSSGR